MVTFLERVHLESPLALKTMPRVTQVGHEKATQGYERFTKFGPDFGYTHCVFQYTLSGMGHISNGRNTYNLPPGTGFLCSFREKNVRYWSSDTSHRDRWEFLYLNFDGGNSHEVTMELVENYGHVYSLPLDLPLLGYFKKLASELVTTRTASPVETTMMVNELLATLCESKTLMGVPSTHFLISEAFKILSHHSDSYFSVAELADRLMVSREHLTRVFRENLGKTPRECIIIEKVKQGSYLLKTTNLSNDEIAHRLGYSSSSLFVGHFKQTVDATPKQYRQALLVGNDLAHKLYYFRQPVPAVE